MGYISRDFEGYGEEMRDKRIADMVIEHLDRNIRQGQVERQSVNGNIARQKPRTNQDALTDEWKLDVKKMARATVSEHVWKADGLVWYGFQIAGSLMRGYVTELDDAIERQAAYLLSPAEDGK